MRCSNFTEGCDYNGDVLNQCSCTKYCACAVCPGCTVIEGGRLTCKVCKGLNDTEGWEPPK